MAKDPVCGMECDPEHAAGSSKFADQTYYFCSPGCKDKFDRDPQRYVGQPSSGERPPHG